MPEFTARILIHTEVVTAWDCLCQGLCRGKAGEEWAPATRIAFPQHGVYVHSVGKQEVVADANHVVIINEDEPFQVSHPVPGGDATLTVGIDRATLMEITPPAYRHPRDRAALNRSGLRVDARTQLLAAQLRQQLSRGSIDHLEGEERLLNLVRHTLGHNASQPALLGHGHVAKMADDVKLLLSNDPWRRWSLTDVADAIGVTPVYLTDAFRRVEGIPLYRYHLRMRLALALSLLADCDDLTTLAVDLGFASHSHFSASFKRTYGLTPSDFKRSIGERCNGGSRATMGDTDAMESARVVLSHSLLPGRRLPRFE